MKRITPSHILLFLLQPWAAVAVAVTGNRPAPPPATPPLAVLHNSDPSFLPIIMTFGCILLLAGFFTIYLWYCSDTRFAAAAGIPTGAFATCCSCGPHGIDPKSLDTFPVFTYSTLKNLKPRIINVPLNCTVCLNEFTHDDSLRLLPKCKHVFHRECIDTWLASHVTCPLCRSRLSPMSPGHEMIVIPNEVNNGDQEFGGSSMRGMNVIGSGETSLRRCHTTTGHFSGFRLPVPANYGRSVSDSSEFYGRHGEGSRRDLLGHCSLANAVVSHGNVSSSSSSSSPQNITLQVERR